MNFEKQFINNTKLCIFIRASHKQSRKVAKKRSVGFSHASEISVDFLSPNDEPNNHLSDLTKIAGHADLCNKEARQIIVHAKILGKKSIVR